MCTRKTKVVTRRFTRQITTQIRHQRTVLCELSRACLLSHVIPIVAFTLLLAALSFMTTSCSTDQTPVFQPIGKTPDQAGAVESETLTQIAAHLSGTWDCSKSSATCVFQTLTFSGDLNLPLNHLAIENYYHFCLIKTEFDLVVEPEKEGVISFSIHASQVGKLEGQSKTQTNCQQVIKNLKPWDENYSLKHTEKWDQITIDEMQFAQVPVVSANTASSPLPSNSPSDLYGIFPGGDSL
jgi:hypothetical protein